MEIKVLDKETGVVYTNNMSDKNKHCILELHFCTSYTQIVVQDELDGNYNTHEIFVEPVGSKSNMLDLIAIKDDDHEGVFIKEESNDKQ